MKAIQIKKIIIVAIAFSALVINVVYGINLLSAFFTFQCDNATREIIISGIALEFGWVVLLGWMIFKPIERRYILLFTVIPIILGNIFHSANQFLNLHKDPFMIALNIGIGILYAALYVLAYFLGRSC